MVASTCTNDSLGVSAPRSQTSHPSSRSRSASIATTSAWRSPAGEPSTIVPRGRPRRTAREPSRPTSGWRCPMPDAPRRRRSGPPASARRSSAAPGRARRCRRRRRRCHLPWPTRRRATPRWRHRRAAEPRADRSTAALRWRAGRRRGRPEHVERRLRHPPLAADLDGLELAEPHVPVRGHVVHAQLVGCLLEREVVDRHVGNGTAVPRPAPHGARTVHDLRAAVARVGAPVSGCRVLVGRLGLPALASGTAALEQVRRHALGGLRQLDAALTTAGGRERSPPRRAAGRRTTAARRPASSSGTSRGRCRRGPPSRSPSRCRP